MPVCGLGGRGDGGGGGGSGDGDGGGDGVGVGGGGVTGVYTLSIIIEICSVALVIVKVYGNDCC